jgi:hypothetical protein
VLEEKSLVSKGARGELRGQPDVRDVLQKRALCAAREVARPCLEQDCACRNSFELIVPRNSRVSAWEQKAYVFRRCEKEIEGKSVVRYSTTVDPEATEVGETSRLNCFSLLNKLSLYSFYSVLIREKVNARLEVVFEEVVALRGLKASVS